MKIIMEDNLSNFNFWSGAKYNADKLTTEQFDTLESILEEEYPEGMTETEINDLFWFDFDSVMEMLGIEEEEEDTNEEDEEE